MKKRLLFLCILLISFVTGYGANLRIAVVDLERIFREYYKSRIAEQAIRQQGEAFRGYLSSLMRDLEQLKEKARNSGTNALNPALTDQAKSAAAETARRDNQAVRAKEAEIELYTAERNTDMRKLQMRKRQEILSEIHQLIKQRAAAEGYTMVLDRSRVNGDQPLVILFSPEQDITDNIIETLNREATRPATTLQEKKK